MLAKRAHKIRGKLISLIHITAYLADKALFLLRHGLRLRLDMVEVILIGHARGVRKNGRLGHVGNEKRMRAAVDFSTTCPEITAFAYPPTKRTPFAVRLSVS